MKKILLLGGSQQQIIAIKTAKDLGYYTILCDYLKNNPGQFVADKFYLASTTDKEAILHIAKKENINGILAYASDPAAPTAAYVAENLGLPTNPYLSIEILAKKNLFRKFLSENGFKVPKSIYLKTFERSVIEKIESFSFPLIIKPIDSSGSKGITKVFNKDDVSSAVNYALSFSRSKMVQIEEYITRDHKYLIGGDIFVLNGEIVFWGLLNCHRDEKVNPLVPVGKSYPLKINEKRKLIIKKELNKLIRLLNIQFGAFNAEIIFNSSDEMYFIELGPRNGGNMIPDLLSMISNKNIIRATVKSAMGDFNSDIDFDGCNNVFATYNLHSDKNGIFKSIKFSEELEKYIVKKFIYIKTDEPVYYFDSANKALGIIFLNFPSVQTEEKILDNINSHIEIILEETQ